LISRLLFNGIAREPIKHARVLDKETLYHHFYLNYQLTIYITSYARPPSKVTYSKLLGRVPIVRASLYEDDATIFVVPKKNDINYLAATLIDFGIIAGLFIKCTKSQVAPTRCEGIDLDENIRTRVHVHPFSPILKKKCYLKISKT
jgi:hypothetical protein